MKEVKTLFLTDILKNIINIYFDTFFVLYFFNVANYEIIPLAKYYITMYFFVGLGFFLIRNEIKKKIILPYYRIGVAFQALYISAIMLLKENIINYIIPIGILKGFADGFYHYPKNILNATKVNNENRKSYSGIMNTVNQISAIVIPLILGISLTYISFVNLGKIFFILFIVIFIISFNLKDEEYTNEKINLKEYLKIIKNNKDLKITIIEPLLSGLTFQSGIMMMIISLSKIYIFKTNLNLGIVDSVCSILCLLSCIIFTKINKNKLNKLTIISGIISFIGLVLFTINPNKTFLITNLITFNSFIAFITLISSYTLVNISNSTKEINEMKAEFYLVRDLMFSISRIFGYIILLIVCLILGKDKINYIMIIPAISILLETIILVKNQK